MRVICTDTIKGDGIENEDVFGVEKNCFWVIDGATDLFGLKLFDVKDDVAFYVRHLSKTIGRFCNEENDLKKVLKDAILETNKTLKLKVDEYESYKLPSFAIVMARINDNSCEYYILGDCFLVIEENGDIKQYTDSRLSAFSKRNREGIIQLRDEDKLNSQSENILFQNTRKYMNKKEGYWIGSPDAIGIDHGLSGIIDINNNTKILGFSDGLYEAFELFKITSLEELDYNKKGIVETVRKLRIRQNEDFERKVTRVRKVDDLTYVLVERT